ncbi:MAG: class I SAM-dependent methyltransferase [Winogradskyella sp.]|uniref:class I SAM-dependent methyltransferase n=1 Tax=Winogradskyella sp. TaxID=1883156 RepID=UPI003859F743
MNFKLKCYVQRFFSSIPNGEKLNYLFQKNITKTLPVSDPKFLFKVEMAVKHHDNFKAFNKVEHPSDNYYEFGAGWDLIIPIAVCHLGYDVDVIDIRKLLVNDLVVDSIERFNNSESKFPLTVVKKEPINKDLSNLKEALGLKYHAPVDARATKYSDNHFDFSSSTSTMEHIPPDDILKILNETYRIMKKGGILSMDIDYIDHWAYFDSSISYYNFLQYSPKAWAKLNPDLNYQNRLRHKDYMDIIAQTPFEVVKNNPRLPNDNQSKSLRNLSLADQYKDYSFEELEITGSEIVLRK